MRSRVMRRRMHRVLWKKLSRIYTVDMAEVLNRDYNPMDIFNQDQEIRQVLMQLINGFYSGNDTERDWCSGDTG